MRARVAKDVAEPQKRRAARIVSVFVRRGLATACHGLPGVAWRGARFTSACIYGHSELGEGLRGRCHVDACEAATVRHKGWRAGVTCCGARWIRATVRRGYQTGSAAGVGGTKVRVRRDRIVSAPSVVWHRRDGGGGAGGEGWRSYCTAGRTYASWIRERGHKSAVDSEGRAMPMQAKARGRRH